METKIRLFNNVYAFGNITLHARNTTTNKPIKKKRMDPLLIISNCLHFFFLQISGHKLGKIFFFIITAQHLPRMHRKRKVIGQNLVKLLSLVVLQLRTTMCLQEVPSTPSTSNISLYLRLQSYQLSAFCSA